MQLPEALPKKDSVLVIDDTPPNLHLLTSMLTRKGYEVNGVSDGLTALSAIQNEIPDLVLLDINMPNMNGFQVCEQLKSLDCTRDIPVIFISARDEVLDKVQAFAVGGVDYITKPFQIAEVLARVENQLTLRRLQKQLQEQNERLKQEISSRIIAETLLQEANEKLGRLVNLDGLTQLANRRCFDEYLDQEWQRLGREHLPLSLIMCDIDFFKNYNDTYGHVAGDDCLRKVSLLIKQSVRRPADLAARYGGEEFAVILPYANRNEALVVAERLRCLIAAQDIEIQDDRSINVTASLGCATFPIDAQTEGSLVTTADVALYQAKAGGRNRVCFSAQEISSSNDLKTL